MVDFIIRYWVEELFAVIIMILTWVIRQLKTKKSEYRVLKEGMVALLHDRLYTACTFFLERGYCTLEDRSNLEYLYEPYQKLGGNGTGTRLYEKVMELPYEETKRGESSVPQKKKKEEA